MKENKTTSGGILYGKKVSKSAEAPAGNQADAGERDEPGGSCGKAGAEGRESNPWFTEARAKESNTGHTQTNPAMTLQEYKYENKRLKMENVLLRDFITLMGRKWGRRSSIK